MDVVSGVFCVLPGRVTISQERLKVPIFTLRWRLLKIAHPFLLHLLNEEVALSNFPRLFVINVLLKNGAKVVLCPVLFSQDAFIHQRQVPHKLTFVYSSSLPLRYLSVFAPIFLWKKREKFCLVSGIWPARWWLAWVLYRIHKGCRLSWPICCTRFIEVLFANAV